MKTYLLTWNPRRWDWDEGELERLCRQTSEGRKVREGWTTGNNKSIVPEDRVFLLRQQVPPTGICASGTATSYVRSIRHWDEEKRRNGEKANYVDITFDTVIDPAAYSVLPIQSLKKLPVRKYLWNIASGGVEIFPDESKTLEAAWRKHLRDTRFRTTPNRLSTVPKFLASVRRLREGGTKMVSLDVHERNPKVKQLCIDHWGTACVVCSMTFEGDYGELGKNFIHAHHLKPMASAKRKRYVDPINDLRPVCPNCHAMLHMTTPALQISQLRAMGRGRLLRK